MHLAESAAQSGTSQLQSPMNFGSRIKKYLQLVFAKTLPLKLHNSELALLFVEINEN